GVCIQIALVALKLDNLDQVIAPLVGQGVRHADGLPPESPAFSDVDDLGFRGEEGVQLTRKNRGFDPMDTVFGDGVELIEIARPLDGLANLQLNWIELIVEVARRDDGFRIGTGDIESEPWLVGVVQ